MHPSRHDLLILLRDTAREHFEAHDEAVKEGLTPEIVKWLLRVSREHEAAHKEWDRLYGIPEDREWTL